MAGSSDLTRGKGAAIAAFIIGLLVILGAWGSQIWGGLVPCELCLGERMPYYWGLPVLAVILLLWNRLPRAVWTVAMLIVAAIFVWSIYLGAFHAGVEWKLWAGPSACTSEGGGLDLSQLSNLNAVKSVPCDVVQWRDPILKLSLAGYNALLSLVVVLLLLVALVGGLRQSQRAAAAA